MHAVSSLTHMCVCVATCTLSVGAGAENNSNVSYTVLYNDTELWLNCSTSSGDSPTGHGQALVLWLRPDGTVLCHGSQGSCLVNQGRWLTYDDSGDYVCKTAAPNGTDSRTVHINVLGKVVELELVFH